MRLVDDRFWRGLRPYIRRIIKHNWEAMPNLPVNTIDEITDNLMKALLKSQNLVFVRIPGVKAPIWPSEIKAKFFKSVQGAKEWQEDGPERDWIYFELNGTTFSGHSTKTTLGNTLRTLCYAWFYIMQAGISDTPWDCEHVFVIASGDDCVIFIDPAYAQQLYATIL